MSLAETAPQADNQSHTAGAPRVAVIGAGPCGLTAIKHLRDAGLRVVAFEATDRIGGNWVFREEESHSSVYETTHIISSRRHSSFDDFPMPADYPDFPSHALVLKYFEDYAARFDLNAHIRLSNRVEQAEPLHDGRWRITSWMASEKPVEVFDAVLVCAGHHSKPYWPPLPGTFTGEIFHAHSYKRGDRFRGKRVLIVGGGNSACDIAVETGRVSARTVISMRRGQHVLPKIILGSPVDVMLWKLRRLPKGLRQFVADRALRIIVGRWEKYGLQRPPRRLLEMHPTLNSAFLDAIRHGAVHPRPGIERINEKLVTFTDARSEEFDTMILATGYDYGFPFLGSLLDGWSASATPPLYLKMIPKDWRNLFFIGLFQPIGCIWTLAQYQARIAAEMIAGRLPLPDNLGERIRRELSKPHWRFDSSRRHAVEVDAVEFQRELLAALRPQDRGGALTTREQKPTKVGSAAR